VPDEHLESPGDPRVADYRDVPDRELLRARGLFVAEGRLVVERLIEQGRYRVRSLLLSDVARAALAPAVARLAPDVPVYICAAAHFEHIAGFHVHRGCLALVERPRPASIDEVLRDARLVVVLEDVANADNVGGVFRNAAAFGADAVLLNRASCDPLYRKAIRTSMGATLTVPFARIDDWPGGLAEVAARGWTIVALTPRQPSVPLDEFARLGLPDRLALVVGAEGPGLSEGAAASAAFRVRIPMTSAVDSLNLAVATGIALSTLSAVSRLTRPADLA